MRDVSVLVGDYDRDSSLEIQRLLNAEGGFRVKTILDSPTALLEIIRSMNPQIVFLSTGLEDEFMDGFGLCSRIMGEFPSTIVIMTTLKEDVEEVRKAMQSGARDIIEMGDVTHRLVDTTYKLARDVVKYESSAMDKKGKVISLLSPKGGVGKSTATINIASYLSSKTNGNGDLNKVVVLDFDLQFGDIAYLSNTQTKRDIADLNELPTVDIDAFKGHLFESEGHGFWVLGAPKSPQYSDVIERETLERAIILSRKLFDYVIIDNPQGFNMPSITSMDLSDVVVIVSSGQMVDMKNLKTMLSTLEKLIDDSFPKDKVAMLLNQYTKHCVPEKEVFSRFTFGSLGTIPRDDNTVANASNYNKSIVKEFPNTEVAKSLKYATDEILHILNPLDSKETKRGGNSKKGFLGKLFGK